MRNIGGVLVMAFLATAAPVVAQELGLGVGLVRMEGRIGAVASDHGVTGRVSVQFGSGRFLRFGLEGAVDRLNEDYRMSTSTCFLPGGGTGACTFQLWERDTGWSLAASVRVQPFERTVTPYAVLGAGFLRVRVRSRQHAEDAAGNPLPNFIYDFTSSDDALQLHTGLGVQLAPPTMPVRFFAEARAIRQLFNYSGGLHMSWNQQVLLGVRVRR